MTSTYLDHNATTPLDPRAAAAMHPWLGERWGNPSSLHRFGQAAREAIEQARAEVASMLGGRPPEIVFTATGTEANNCVVESVASAAGYRGEVVMSALEHPSVDRAVRRLAATGMKVIEVRPGADGVVRADEFAAALTGDTRLACLMLASNEIGTLQPVAEVARFCRQRGVPLLCDAMQGVGKMPVDVTELGVDYLTVCAHKLNGPLGAGAIWVRRGAQLIAQMVGGSQERRRRAGTENVPALVGFGRAAVVAEQELGERAAGMLALRRRFEAGLAAIGGIVVHGADVPRLPNTSHLAVGGVEGEALMIRLDLAGFAVSTGSACSSGVVEPSPVLLAMGLTPREAQASIRVSFGASNTADEVDAFLAALASEVVALRRLAPVAAAPVEVT